MPYIEFIRIFSSDFFMNFSEKAQFGMNFTKRTPAAETDVQVGYISDKVWIRLEQKSKQINKPTYAEKS